jgi:hypothetical protein
MSEVSTTPVGAPQSPFGDQAATEQAAPEAITEELKAAEVPPKEEQKIDPFAPKFAALSRKEKQLRQYEASVKAKEAELQKKLEEMEGRSKETDGKLKTFEEDFKSNPIKALKDRGLSLEDLIKIQMNDEQPTVEMQMKRMKEELESSTKKELEELRNSIKQKEEQEAQQRYEQAIKSYKSEISNFIDSNADTYELIKANDASDLMFEVAEEYYKNNKKVLDIKEVADVVEQHLEAEAKKILELKKFKQTSPAQPKPSTQTAPTLSNTAAANVPSNGSRKLSNEESLREAAKLIRWDE